MNTKNFNIMTAVFNVHTMQTTTTTTKVNFNFSIYDDDDYNTMWRAIFYTGFSLGLKKK